MQWSRIKTILIIFLAVINILLFLELQRISHEQNYITEQYAVDSSSALSKLGISVDPSVIPLKKPNVPVVIYNADETLQKMGNNVCAAYQNSSFTVSGLNFQYKNNGQGTAAKSPSSSIQTFFKLFGVKENEFKIKNISSDGTQAEAEQLINGIPVYGGVKFKISGNIVLEAQGTWIVSQQMSEKKQSLPDAINVLFSIARGDSLDKQEISNIQSIELVYMPSGSSAFKNAQLAPSYLFVLKNGTKCYYDLSSSVFHTID
ncbi:MAG: hypothetical protein Q8865_00155 [Bacillota bacterium]|nr:hypothetical protein [Bacillota bacterium]